MREIERLMIVRRIKNFMKEKDDIKVKCEELKILLNDESVKRYLTLSKEIEEMEKEHSRYDTLEKRIQEDFWWALDCNYRDRETEILPCTHEIWIYNGSYCWWEDPYSEHSKFYNCEDENEETFRYNEYVCLECGRKLQEKNWEEFESTHYVLKNKNCYHTRKFAKDYRKLYFQLLFNNKASIAQKKLIEIFEKDKVEDEEKVKVKR